MGLASIEEDVACAEVVGVVEIVGVMLEALADGIFNSPCEPHLIRARDTTLCQMPPEGKDNATPSIYMEWANLLFLHWRVDPQLMLPLIPSGLELDTFDGSAWIALVPFRMQNTRFRGVPSFPGVANFYECNVRTYVKYRGRSGVWFFSLDAETFLPVLGGRLRWSLNYVHSDFEVRQRLHEPVTDYKLLRRIGPWRPAQTNLAWRSGSELPRSQPGTLEHFLTERYWLFTKRMGVIVGGQVEHEPWSLREAEVLHLEDSLVAAAGLNVKGSPLAWSSDILRVKGHALRAVH